MNLDPRLTPLREGLAARSLEGVAAAAAYADAKAMRCVAPAAAIRRAPEAASEQMDQLLFGEVFETLDIRDGFAWGQARRDGYVGFVEAPALGAMGAAPTHRVAALRTYAFAEASIKTKALGPFCLNALVTVEATEGRFRKVEGSGWFIAEHLAPIGEHEDDPATVAEGFLAAPYLWGGRQSLGLDCSGLVQAAMFACGRSCPRDTDQQAMMGEAISQAELRRGDLVFWKGHVAMMLDATRIIHANGHHMAVVVEPLAEAVARIGATVAGPPSGFRRP